MGDDIIGPYDASAGFGQCSPPESVPGKVDEACRFRWYPQLGPSTSEPGVIHCDDNPFEDIIKSGDFTIDAWIFPEDNAWTEWGAGGTAPKCRTVANHCEYRPIVCTQGAEDFYAVSYTHLRAHET